MIAVQLEPVGQRDVLARQVRGDQAAHVVALGVLDQRQAAELGQHVFCRVYRALGRGDDEAFAQERVNLDPVGFAAQFGGDDHVQRARVQHVVERVTGRRFQQELADWAIEQGKLPGDYVIPEAARKNTPYRIAKSLSSHIADGLLPAYPFGTDLTDEELTLSASLRRIKALSDEPTTFLREILRALLHRGDKEAARPWLERIQLLHPESSRDFIVQQLLLLELEEHGLLKVR